MPTYLRAIVPSVLIVLFLVAAAMPQPALAQAGNEKVGEELKTIVFDGVATPGADDDDERLIQVFTFYEDRSFKPLWVRDDGPKTKALRFLEILRSSHEEGLNPASYRIGEIEPRIASEDPRQLAEAEILFARAMIDYGRDITAGRVEPMKVDGEHFIYPSGPGAVTLLDGAEQAGDIGPYIQSLAPQTPNYARLKQALADYRAMARNGPWTQVPKDETLKEGMQQARVPVLRKRLEESGDLAPGAHSGDVYDGALVEAVKAFQARHGIDIDGAVGPDTLTQINTPLSYRIWQLEMNMERRRWMNDDLGSRYVFVNLADQYLKVVDNGKTVHTARTVVGKSFHRTPVFSKEIKYLVMNPYWNVPSSIATNEYLPKLKQDPGYLSRQNIRILKGNTEINPFSVDWHSVTGRFPFRLRQDSGPKNALGRIKFMFPNQFNVYIHDTPSKSLFSRTSRFYSHGCIRVQHPTDLAEVLLRTQGWTKAKIENVIAGGKKRIVRLKAHIPVHITYLTAWANKDGSVHFRKDIYGRDEKLGLALGASLAN